jgi:RNA polymerase sigma factor (sigma-70 family)
MNGETGIAPAQEALSDRELVAGTREGDESAFEELYRRYRGRIKTFVRGLVHDDARAEDITQEAFFSALRRLRATDSEIAFKPWIYEIARNAAIDSYRRTSRSEEVSIDADDLTPSDRVRLVGASVPDSVLVVKERLDHLRGALDELSDTHHRIIVMRELEGLSYREIGERLELSRPAVESTLFRARRRLEREYEELDTGRRCHSMRGVIARMAEGIEPNGDARRLARHLRRCSLCRRRARELGVAAPTVSGRFVAKVGALLPLPAFLRRRGQAAAGGADANVGTLGTMLVPTAHVTATVAERAVAVVAAAAIAGAGGAMLATPGPGPEGSAPPAAGAVHNEGSSAVTRAVVREGEREGAEAAPIGLDRITDRAAALTAPARTGFGSLGTNAPAPAPAPRTSGTQGMPLPALPKLPLEERRRTERGEGESGNGSSALGVRLEGIAEVAPPAGENVAPLVEAAKIDESPGGLLRAAVVS